MSPLTSERQVPTFHTRARIMLSPPPCRMPPRSINRHCLDLSRSNENSAVLTSSFRFTTRHQWFTCVRLHDSYLTGLSGLFHTRSLPRLLSVAAVGGLKPPPVRRLRGAYPHLSCSMTAQTSLSCAPSWHTPIDREVIVRHQFLPFGQSQNATKECG